MANFEPEPDPTRSSLCTMKPEPGPSPTQTTRTRPEPDFKLQNIGPIPTRQTRSGLAGSGRVFNCLIATTIVVVST